MPAGFEPLRIFITGFMGSGKTHWAKIWAEKYKLVFYDLDELIEANEEMKITEIFNTKGEAYFRAAEAKALRTFSFQKNFILACGGGTPCFHENMEWMNSHGITIYLKTQPATIANRLMNEVSNRPLIKDTDPKQLIGFATQKIIEREIYYLRSVLILNEDEINENSLSVLDV